MRLVFIDASEDYCAKLFGIDSIPTAGQSVKTDKGIVITNATPAGKHLIESLDITLIINLSATINPLTGTEIASDFIGSVGAGILSSAIYERLKDYVAHNPKKLMVDGEIIANEKALRKELEKAAEPNDEQ